MRAPPTGQPAQTAAPRPDLAAPRAIPSGRFAAILGSLPTAGPIERRARTAPAGAVIEGSPGDLVPPGRRGQHWHRADPDPADTATASFWAATAAWAPPPSSAAAPAPTAGTALGHAEVAALAERLLTSLRVGRSGRGGRELRLRLAGALEGVEVRLRHEGGLLSAELCSEPWATERAASLARRLGPALAARGAPPVSIEVR
jgi:hypothetical protein